MNEYMQWHEHAIKPMLRAFLSGLCSNNFFQGLQTGIFAGWFFALSEI